MLDSVDWLFVIGFFLFALIVGILVSRKAGRSSSDFFLSGRHMPWWLLGFSMVATTFSTDTPNLVSDFVRQNGVAGNWRWWAFLLTGMVTVFIYAKLWRRSNVFTDVEFYEIRYSGRPAAFLRGFRAIYLGVFFNIVIMASVTLAAVKIAGVLLGLAPWQTIAIAAAVTVIYSMLGGLTGVLITDFLLFIVAMAGAIAAAVVAVNHEKIGSLSVMLNHPNLEGKLSFLPAFDISTTEGRNLLMSIFVIPLAVQWWSVWYPGSEPGGGGYLVQRMLAAKNEKHAMGATLFFNFAHYAMRPWPWIIVALCSLIVFPDVEALQKACPNMDPDIVKDDLSYPAMLTFLPHGLLGLVVASLIAAYMSTISTHLNWGSSYVVNDFYKRFIRPNASERHLVTVGRISTVLMMGAAGMLALPLKHAEEAFTMMLQIGAGTGLIFILRWFWWRINAYSELTAMVVSFVIACYFKLVHEHLKFMPNVEEWLQIVIGVGITTMSWITVAFLTRAADDRTLFSFCRQAGAGGPGWKAVFKRAEQLGTPIEQAQQKWDVPFGILCTVFGCMAVYATLFATGYWIYGNEVVAGLLTAVAVFSMLMLLYFWPRIRFK